MDLESNNAKDAEKEVNEYPNKEDAGLTHNCGVFGCISTGEWPAQIDVAEIICFGLVSLQHRGQESAGIVTSKGVGRFASHKGMGLVSQVFDEQSIQKLKGNLGIGHTRYSTTAASAVENCQPFVVHTQHGQLAVAHNGELINAEALRKNVQARGAGLSTTSDSELITQSLCLIPPEGELDGPDWVARIKNFMKLSPLSYALVLMYGDRIYGVRDPYGNRPLCLGKVSPLSIGKKKMNDSHNQDIVNADNPEENIEGFVISSESSGFQAIGARYIRDVEPGEIVELTKLGIKSLGHVGRLDDKLPAFCIFEYVYFARPDSIFEGQAVYSVRMQCGKELAKEAPCDADIVSSVPESGTAAAHGYAKQSGIPFAEVLCKNRYVGRTFIQPSARLRQIGVAKKFGALLDNVLDKRIILIDDSIVRGNTIGPIIKLLKNAGAKEVHVRIASPPVKYPCYMGINIPTREELIANQLDAPHLAEAVGADSLAYLSIEGLKSAVTYNIAERDPKKIGHCFACLSGQYPEKLKW